MLYIGIDFSISSPAYAIIEDDDFIKWGSITRSDRTAESHKKNPVKPYYILDENPDLFSLLFMEKDKMPDVYSERERLKIDYFLVLVNKLWDSILEEVGDKKFTVAMEGLSFASNGNALIDISMATALLRERIVGKIGSDKFYVYSPTSIKKFAIKGNAKKDQLYTAICESGFGGENLSSFTKLLKENEHEWVTPKKAVNKPIDDLVDATWIALYLKSEVENSLK